MRKPVIIISGKNGQLGRELQNLAAENMIFDFFFFDKKELNIADESSLRKIFEQYSPSVFINTAAYTAVDKAETEQGEAFKINAEAAGSVAEFCYRFKTKLLHISTDYVFDGEGGKPYSESDVPNPVNYYGYTKWLGERLALNNNPGTFIIRTSWVYSAYGNNFVKTMLRLMHERTEINVVNDQYGAPTYARDLAEVILLIVNGEWSMVNGECLPAGETKFMVNEKNEQSQTSNLKPQTSNFKPQTPNVFHFSNDGVISWYEFALAIKEIKQLDCVVHPIPTSAYPTSAKRPAYSVLDKTKICEAFNIQLKDWKESLKECLQLL